MSDIEIKPYTKLDVENYQLKTREVRCPLCARVYVIDIPNPVCSYCDAECITIIKPISER